MKRKIWAFALTLTLLGTAAEAAPTPKAGAKCTQKGVVKIVKGKKFVCSKSKTSLIWRVSNPDPKPDVIEPTDTKPKLLDVFGNETSAEALIIDKLADIAWEKGKPGDLKINTEIHERVKGKLWAEDASTIMPFITRIMDGVGAPVTGEVDWYVWWDLASLRPKLPDNCWAKYDGAFVASATGAGYCIPKTIFIFYDAYQQWYSPAGFLEKYPNEWDKYGLIGVAAGEVAHFSQNIYGDKFNHRSANFYPAWLREGPSVLYSALAYAKFANLPYSTVRNLALRHFNLPNCGNIPMTDLLMFNQSSSFCEYYGGFLASEYLVASTGDILAPFRYLESKIPGNGDYCEDIKGICLNSYKSVIAEMYTKDVDKWHADIHEYVKRWAK
jgi:hypothetical protein